MTASFPASYPPQIRARSSCSRLRRLGLEGRRDWCLERMRDSARVSTAHSSRILSSRWRADLPDLTRRWRGLCQQMERCGGSDGARIPRHQAWRMYDWRRSGMWMMLQKEEATESIDGFLVQVDFLDPPPCLPPPSGNVSS